MISCATKSVTAHKKSMHQYNLPVIFGILTTHNKEQALERVGGKKGHKGKYCVQAALTMAKMKEDVEKRRSINKACLYKF